MRNGTGRYITFFALILALFLLSACGATSNLPPAAGSLGIEIDPDTITTDSNGVQVGFTKDGHAFRGDPDAPIIIQEFSDYECPFCARFHANTLSELESNRIATGDALLIYYDFPLTSIHPYAVGAAHAARCAGEQGADKYWLMHDALFANLGQWNNSNIVDALDNYAVSIGIDKDSFGTCMDAQAYLQAIEEDIAYGRSRNVTGTPAFFVNDQFLSGAQPITAFEQLITQIMNGDVVVEQNGGAQAVSATVTPPVAPTPIPLNVENAAGVMGDESAPVTIVEYTDYGCPFCARHSIETMPPLIQTMVETGRVRYILKDLPLDRLHPEARGAAYAARCAGEQDAYWEMHDALFAAQAEWSGRGDDHSFTEAVRMAGEIGLEVEEFEACLSSGRYVELVQQSVEEANSLGITGTPFFLVNGYPLSGAQPLQVFELAIEAAEDGTLADLFVQRAQQQAQAQAQQPPQIGPPTPSGPVEVPIGDEPILGDPDAPITIVEYSDFQCPFCGRHHSQTMPLLMQNYIDSGQVRYIFKHFAPTLINPSYHPQAVDAAMAAECANDQGAFWEMHDQLFNTQGQWGNSNAVSIFSSYAEAMGLDVETFDECMSSEKYLESISETLAEGQALGVRGTPAFFVNGNFVNGAQPYQVFEQILTQMLADISAN